MSPILLRRRIQNLTKNIDQLIGEYDQLLKALDRERRTCQQSPQRVDQIVEALNGSGFDENEWFDYSDLTNKVWVDVSPARLAQWAESLETNRAILESHLQTLRPLFQ